MDIKALVSYLFRKKWIIMGVTLLFMLLSVFFVMDMPKQYVSVSQISTGLTDQSQQTSGGRELDYFRVSTQFGNIIEMMTSSRAISILTNKLMLHDLNNPNESFTEWSDDLKNLSDSQRHQAVIFFEQKLAKKEPVSLNENSPIPYFDIVASMGYDQQSLQEGLTVERSGESDFINVSYVSTDPDMSSYVVNTFANEFIVYYSSNAIRNQKKSLTLLDSLLKDKERVMNERNAQLKNYKIGSGVLNLDKQSEVLYQQISALEEKRSQTINQIQSLQGTLANINKRLGTDATGLDESVAENNELVDIERKLQIANQRYIDGNFDKEAKKSVDSLTELRRQKLARSSDRYTVSPLIVKQGLNEQKLKLETDLAMAQSGMASLDAGLKELRQRYNIMVPTDAGVQNLQRDAEVATKEYLDALNRYNQTNIDTNTGIKLHISQEGLPGTPEPSKRVILVGLSGFSGLTASLAIFFLLFITDKRITDPNVLQKKTSQQVFGSLNLIKNADRDLRSIWEDDNTNLEYTLYKDLLRSLRFEVDREFKENKINVLGITSLSEGAGKTFLASSLAYGFAMMSKNVLLICEDTPNLLSLISNNEKHRNLAFETFLVKKEIKVEERITILNRNPKNNSLVELNDSNTLFSGFEHLKSKFDVILVDMNSLYDLNKVKEWLMFTDRFVSVFESGESINERDMRSIDFLNKQKGFMGWVFNKIDMTDGNH